MLLNLKKNKQREVNIYDNSVDDAFQFKKKRGFFHESY